MKTILVLLIVALCTALTVGQTTFSDGTAGLFYTSTRSGAPFAAADMNADGLDDIVRLHLATTLRIDYQTLRDTFAGYSFGNLQGGSSEWGIAVADVDQNGFNDVIAGGPYNDLKLLKANSTGTSYTQSLLPDAPPNGIFLQSSNFADINNDGAIDYFGCHDDGLSAPYRGDNTGTFVWDTTLINARSTIPSDNSGNYGSVWTDYDWDGDLDLFITKCRGGVFEPLDGRRLNLMFENDGTNEFSEVAEEIGLRPLAQSWCTDFGDLDNDGDMDALIVMHSQSPKLYYNDGTNHYFAMNDSAGIAAQLDSVDRGIQIIMEDFDNNGLLDILITNNTGGPHRLFWNQGDMQFDDMNDRFPEDMARIHSAAVGDFNHDGFMDIIAGHGTGYNNPHSTITDDLLLNDGNDNHFLSVRTIGDSTHINGIGARLELWSDLGRQLRDIRSGESYGIMNSLNAHFGLAGDELVDSLAIYWPSGTTDLYRNLRVDQFLTLREGIGPCDCENPGEQIVTELTGSGPGSLPDAINIACPCDTIRLDESLVFDTLMIDQKLMIGKDVIIKGYGTAKSFIATTTSGPALRIQPGVRCTFSNLTFTDEAVVPPTYLIENLGTLTLSEVVVNTSEGHPLRPDTGTIVVGQGTTVIK